jgi:TonB family protein
MKECPLCHRGNPDTSAVCVRDGAVLSRYDLRGALRARRNRLGRGMFMPLAQECLPARLAGAAAGAGADFRRDPPGFVRNLFCGYGDAVYSRSLRRSAACALIAVNACFSALLLFVGVFRPSSAEVNAPVHRSDTVADLGLRLIAAVDTDARLRRRDSGGDNQNRSGRTGGGAPERNSAQGGVGGGNGETLPARQGGPVLPSLLPQIVPPRVEPARIEHASLTYPETILVDPLLLPPSPLPTGDPEGVVGSNFRGSGNNGGMGRGSGGGLGADAGGGFRTGFFGGTGRGAFRAGSNRPDGDGDEIPWANERVKPQILYKEKARYTETARSRQIQGTVILRATFNAEGRITDIFVVRGLPEGLTEMAIEAAQRIRFRPAMRDGAPVSVRASLEYNFVLY